MHHIDEETIGRKEEKITRKTGQRSTPNQLLICSSFGRENCKSFGHLPILCCSLGAQNGGDHRQGCFVCSGETRELPTSDLLSLVIKKNAPYKQVCISNFEIPDSEPFLEKRPEITQTSLR